MKEVEIRFDTKEFERQLNRLGGEEVGRILAVGVYEAMGIVAQEARQTAPDSGIAGGSTRKVIRGTKHNWKLKDAIKVKQVVIASKSIIGRVVALPFYARFVEKGVPSRGIAPNPFMRKAADNKRPAAVSKFADSVRQAVEQALR
jgi:HK97 gp10 family phage protein